MIKIIFILNKRYLILTHKIGLFSGLFRGKKWVFLIDDRRNLSEIRTYLKDKINLSFRLWMFMDIVKIKSS